eukprot:10999027-Alexandrium_andersonii.AAC.1
MAQAQGDPEGLGARAQQAPPSTVPQQQQEAPQAPPHPQPAAPPAPARLPPGWQWELTAEGMIFYIHTASGTRTWNRPLPGLPPGPLDHGELYAILDLQPSANSNDILRAFRAQARALHPDKHPE